MPSFALDGRRNGPARYLGALLLVSLVSALAAGSMLSPVMDGAQHASVRTLFQEEPPLPVADAGSNRNVTQGDAVFIDGSASFGFEGVEGLNFTWRVTYVVTTFYVYGVNGSFTASNIGLYTVNLTVRDSLNRTSYDVALIVVKAPPKTFLELYWAQILALAILLPLPLIALAIALGRIIRKEPVIPPAKREKTKLVLKKWRQVARQVLKNRMGLLGIIILTFFGMMAIVGPMVAGDVKTAINDPNASFQPPSKQHLLGTDNFGIDIFRQLLYGARTSMIVGVFAAIIASFFGAAVGLYSGYAGGWKDEVVMRLNDIVLSIPWLVLMIIVAALIGQISLLGIILIIGLTGWSYTARMVRAQVLSVKERQYIERARAIGSSDLNIISKHVFPNTFPLIFANTILTVAVSILSEATLSFLRFRPQGEVTWGTMLSYASEFSAFSINLHWWILAPGLCIVAVVLGFTLLGYALDEILNPKLRRR